LSQNRESGIYCLGLFSIHKPTMKRRDIRRVPSFFYTLDKIDLATN